MSLAGLVWANLRAHPARLLLNILAVTCAFALYGLAMRFVEGISLMAAARHIETGPGPLLGAMALSGIGFLLILFLTANAAMQSVRLRMGEFGVLKAIGFSHRRIILLVTAEILVPCLAGAALGLLLAQPLLPPLVAVLPLPDAFPPMSYSPAILGGAIALAVLLGAISAALPALRIVRMNVVDALADRNGGARNSPAETAASVEMRQPLPVTAAAGNFAGIIVKPAPHLLRQIAMMTRMGLSTLGQRWKGALSVVAALMVVTLVMNPLLILIDSFRTMMRAYPEPLHVVVSQPGKRLDRSRIPAAWADIIRQAPGVARAANGAPLADAHAFLRDCEHPERAQGERGICVDLTGLGTMAPPLRPAMTLLRGRFPRLGSHEIIMASYAATREGAGIGTKFTLRGQQWQVTGVFEPQKGWYRNASFGDAAMVRAASEDPASNSMVLVRLATPDAFEKFRAALQADTRLQVAIARQDDFYRDFANGATGGWIVICYVVGAIISLGAGAGILHQMQVTVEEREREMAVLRAMGFGNAAVASAVVLEALLLAAFGAAAGLILLWLWLEGVLYRGMLTMEVQPGRMAMAIGWSLGVALIGALSPALAATRSQVAQALRR